MLANRLKEYYPGTWTDRDYSKVIYYLENVNSFYREHSDVVQPFQKLVSFQLLRVQRVQHPLAYLKYTLQSEYLKEKNMPNVESIVYHKVKIEDKHVALSYNCDDRRYKHSTENFHTTSVDFGRDEVLIVVRKREGDFEKNMCPMYVIYKHNPTRDPLGL